MGQKVQHTLLKAALLSVLELRDHLQVGRLRVGRDQLEIDRRRCRRCTVLAGEREVFSGSS